MIALVGVALIALIVVAYWPVGHFGVVRIVSSRPYLAMGWFWYLIALVPVLGFVQVGLQPRVDRFSHAAGVTA